jgi:hypothetical protein
MADALQLAEARRYAASGRGQLLRRAARLSLSDVGRAIGTSHVTVLRYESGREPHGEVGARYGAFCKQLERRGFADDEIAEAVQ